MIFRYEVPQASMKSGRASSDTEQKHGFEPDTSAPVRTCLHVGVHVSTVTPFTDWMEKPTGVYVTVYKPSLEEWMCQITQRPPLGQSCRCTCGRMHVQNSLCTARNHVVVSHFLPLTRSSCVSFLFAFRLSSLSSASQTWAPLPLRHSQKELGHFPPLPLLCRCHNLDDSLISNYLRPNFRELVCFSVDWEAN